MKSDAIFLSFDDNYLSYARSCINSIFSNYPEHPVILINYNGSHQIVRDEDVTSGRVRFINLNNAFNFSLGPINNSIVFNRYFLWSDLFKSYDNILHLDVDTIVLKPLDTLFQKREFFISSDNDKQARTLKFHDQKLKRLPDTAILPPPDNLLLADGLLSLKEPHSMANAGVFVIPATCRDDIQFKLLLDLAEKYDPYVAYADQSIISIWCAKNGIPISTEYSYNHQIRFFCDRHCNVQDIHILHYSGEAKFYENYVSNANHREIYRLCDSVRLFYRIIRSSRAAEEKLEPLKRYLDALHYS